MASSIARTATLFQKLLSGRHVTYRSLEQQEDINRRTALRWIKEAKHVFGDALKEDRLDSGEKSFWLDSEAARWIGGFRHRLPTSEEMAALDKAVQVLRREGLAHEVNQLTALRSKVHGVVEKAEQAMKTDTDTEAIIDSWGIVSRPGPHIRPSENVAAPLREAIPEAAQGGVLLSGPAGRRWNPPGSSTAARRAWSPRRTRTGGSRSTASTA